ncbi:hypothetical protein RND71_015722 [Anisodus tanguticus]|uniref:Uncharacterized protein n=1 Tax=Anisodus tanguticus TaxID=243964 RepID=A0AAE1S4S9_9SOLA|nr:hypothetical protein RND71_015722 [Anisodus tanguticus]
MKNKKIEKKKKEKNKKKKKSISEGVSAGPQPDRPKGKRHPKLGLSSRPLVQGTSTSNSTKPPDLGTPNMEVDAPKTISYKDVVLKNHPSTEEGLNQGLTNYGHQVWLQTLFQEITQDLALSITFQALTTVMREVTKNIPFCPTPNPEMLPLNPQLVQWTTPPPPNPMQIQSTIVSTTTSLMESQTSKEPTLDALRSTNKEMERMLTSMKVPKSDAITQNNLRLVEFNGPKSEMLIVHCLKLLTKYAL